MFMAVVMLFCTASVATYALPTEEYPGHPGFYGTLETGCFGSDHHPLIYPITGRYLDHLLYQKSEYDTPEFYIWYQGISNSDRYTDVGYFAYRWYDYHVLGDPEIWPEEYRNYFNEILPGKTVFVNSHIKAEDGSAKPKYRVDDCSFDGRTMTAVLSADYQIEYNFESLYDGFSLEGYYNRTTGDDFSMMPVLFFTDKNGDDIVHIAKAELESVIEPYYKYGAPSDTVRDEIFYYNYGIHPEDADGTAYDGTTTETVVFDMPAFYDPDKHSIILCFDEISTGENDAEWFCNPYRITEDGAYADTTIPDSTVKPTPTPTPEPEPQPVHGDVNPDGKVNITDASLMLKYVAGWNITVDVVLADLNQNGRVDISDASICLKLITGWKV